jgi:hypothetical protein
VNIIYNKKPSKINNLEPTRKSMDKNIFSKWERFLDPESLRTNLILASIYITAFEILKNSIIENLRDFYITGFDENGWIIMPAYKEEVLLKDKNLTFASLKWLKESQAIDEDDIEKFSKVKECRNLVAHEIPKMLINGLPIDISERFSDMTTLLDKIEKWWIVNVEIPTNHYLDNDADKIDEEGILPGPIAGLKMMIDIALGSDETANYYINEINKKRNI